MSEANVPAEQSDAGEEPRFPPPDVDPSRPGHREGPPAQGPRPPVGLIWRIRDDATFSSLRRASRRARHGAVTVSWVPGSPSDPPRVAFAIGRKVGGAVVRNRLRRRLRAIAAELELPPGAYLIGAAPAAATVPFGELRALVSRAVQDVAR